MLEVRHLCKAYRPKKGVPVTAVDDVSLVLPDRGMVFLLGKSGSGKSTLLNLLGGLDRYDSGEILINGVSSKEFKQQHFDSYRNTYVGFIFQEYNLLEEFTVGANVALAIELQGRRAEDEEINSILKQVDLAGYGYRRPNELSGGQRQRVAIARALVKDPQIIMADEPTGALDSATGRQVLDTLKALSAEKLVLVVSHDREFAERYADRIVELADGRVISDTEYTGEEPEPAAGLTFEEKSVLLPADYRLTEEDRLAINAWLEARERGEARLLSSAPSGRRGTPTDQSRITSDKTGEFRLIKSKLPMRNAVKIGAGALKYKKVRLVVTIFLSCVAFGLFGMADTFASYDHVTACVNSLLDTGVTYVSVEKQLRYGEGEDAYYRNTGDLIGEEDLAAVKRDTGITMDGIYIPTGWEGDLRKNYDPSVTFTETDVNVFGTDLVGLAPVSEELLRDMGYSLIAGRLPKGDREEIALSAYLCETFYVGGYVNAAGEKQPVKGPSDMVGKTLQVGDRQFTVTGVVDTRFDIGRYRDLTKKKENASTGDALIDYALARELWIAQNYSLIQTGMVGEGYISRLRAGSPNARESSCGRIWLSGGENANYYIDVSYYCVLEDTPPECIVWLDGEKKTLGPGEIILSGDALMWAEDEYTYRPGNYHDREEFTRILRDLGPLQGEKMLWERDMESLPLTEVRVVGYIPDYSGILVGSDTLMEGLYRRDGIYHFAVGAMPASRGEVEKLVSYCYREDSPVRYQLQNPVTYELDAMNELLKSFARAFLYVGLFIAAFAALMLSSFIAASVSYKKQEIGILRAIGSRSHDVFRIFFSESFIIAMINFLLALSGTATVVSLANLAIRSEAGLLVTVLHFGIRQVLLLFFVSLAVAAVASFIPVYRIASKKPIDAIRNR